MLRRVLHIQLQAGMVSGAGAMPGLDFFDISTIVAALAGINAIAFIVVWRINPTVPGLGSWSLSQCLHVGAWLLAVLGMAGILNGYALIATSNSFNLCAMLLLIDGAVRFRDFGRPAAYKPLLTLAILLVVTISILNREAQEWRYLWHDGICVVALIVAALVMMWRTNAQERIVHGMAAGFFLLVAATAAYRWLVTWTRSAGEGFPYPHLNATLFTLVALCALGWVYGLMLSVNLRVRQQMLAISQIDPLTGLANRHQLETVLTRALARLARGGPGFGLCFFDLDRFKSVNDRYGHAGGDAMLVAVADRLRAGLGAGELAARIGGDEFVVFFNDIDGAGALAAAGDHLRRLVEGPVPFNDAQMQVWISLGTAHAPGDGRDIDSLLRHADATMYLDKRHRHAAHPPSESGVVLPFPTDRKGRPGGAARN